GWSSLRADDGGVRVARRLYRPLPRYRPPPLPPRGIPQVRLEGTGRPAGHAGASDPLRLTLQRASELIEVGVVVVRHDGQDAIDREPAEGRVDPPLFPLAPAHPADSL